VWTQFVLRVESRFMVWRSSSDDAADCIIWHTHFVLVITVPISVSRKWVSHAGISRADSYSGPGLLGNMPMFLCGLLSVAGLALFAAV
jgi:hypothetical protein